MWQKDTVSVTHVGGFGSFGNAVDGGRHSLWMLQARLPNHPHMCNVALSPSARQRVPWGDSPSTGGTGSKVGIRVFNMCIHSSLWGSDLKNMEKERFGAAFCSVPQWCMTLQRFCTFVPTNWKVSGEYSVLHKHCPDAQHSEQHLPG